MDPAQLVAVLGYTFSPDQAQRNEAEELMKQLPSIDGAPHALLQIVGNREQCQVEVRRAAAIAFKNVTKNNWEPLGRARHPALPAQSKPGLRNALFEVLLGETDKPCRDLLAESVNQIARCDYPQLWPQLLPEILAHVQSGEPLRIHNSLLALRHVVKRLEYKNRDMGGRQPLEVIISTALPLMHQLARQLIESQNHSLEAAMILKLCLKVLWSCTHFALPDGAARDGVGQLGGWLDLLAAVIAKPLPEASEGLEPAGQPTVREERDAWPWWKLKKWALQIGARWFHRYGMPKYADDESQLFAQQFSTHYAPRLLEPILGILALKPQGRYCSDRCTHLALVYVESAVQLGATHKLLKPHIGSLLTDVVFPQLCLSDSDVELFDSDPLEFVRKLNDPMEDFQDPSMAATQLLESVMKYRKSNLGAFLGFVTDCLNEYAAAPPQLKNARKKDGSLMALAVLSEILKEKKQYKSQLEPLLVAHVFPEFGSPVGFLRMRACKLTQYFYNVEFSDPAHVASLLNYMLQALRDPALPVQVEAANGLRHLIELEGTEALLTPVLPDLLNEFFRIMSDIGAESVVSALEVIIEKFDDQIMPHAAMLVQQLCESFMSYASEGSEDDEAAMAANQCMDCVTTVLNTIADSASRTQLFIQVQPFLVQVLGTIIHSSDDYIEYLETALEILTYVTYFASDVVDSSGNKLPPPSPAEVLQAIGPYVGLFPAMAKAFHEYAYDHIPEMMSPIDNMIGFATDVFLGSQDAASGQSFVQITLGMAEKVFGNGGVRSNAKEAMCATHLLLSLLHNCKGRIDAFLPGILNLVMQRLDPQPTPREVPVRIPEGCSPGQAIPLKYMDFDGTVTCPPGVAPGSEVNFTITMPPVECTEKLKLALLQVIASAFFYNAALAFAHFDSVPGLVQKVFEFWFKEVDERGKDWPHLPTKLTVLGWTSILQLPADQIPAVVRDRLPIIIARCLHLVKEIDDQNQDGGEDDDEYDVDGEEDDDEDDEDEEAEEDESEEEEEGADTTDHADLAYLKSIKNEQKKMLAFAQHEADSEQDLYDDGDDYSSPIDDVDELMYLVQMLQAASTAQPQFYGAIQGQLDAQAQQNYAALVQRAQQKMAEQAVQG